MDFQKMNEEQCYSLGLLWADGYLYSLPNGKGRVLSLECLEDDFQYFESPLATLGKLSQSTRLRENRKRALTRGIITNYNLVSWLYENNFTNKSYLPPTNIWTQLNPNQKRHFLRGFSDGDGCFYINPQNRCFQFVLAGSEDQEWEWLTDYLTSQGIVFYHKIKAQKQNGKINHGSIIRITRRDSLIKLRGLLYDEATCCLPRKKDKAFQIPNPRVRKAP